MSRVLGDDHYIRMPRVTGVWHCSALTTAQWPWVPGIGKRNLPCRTSMAISAEHWSKFAALQWQW